MSAPNLRVVQPADEPSAEDNLSRIVPDLMAAERVVAQLRLELAAERVRLAKERRVAFLREEAVRREFGRP
jgi:hypothetical protein